MAKKTTKTRDFGSMSDFRGRFGTYGPTHIPVPEGYPLLTITEAKPTVFDFLPYVTEQETEFVKKGVYFANRTYFIHKGVGPKNRKYCCPLSNWNRSCPICETRATYRRKPKQTKKDEDIIKALSPKSQQLWMLIDLKDPDAGVQIWDYSFFLFGEQLHEELNNAAPDERLDDFWRPDGGMSLRIGWREEHLPGSKPFYKARSIRFLPRKKQYDWDFVDTLPCLDRLLIEPGYDELAEVFTAGSEDDSKLAPWERDLVEGKDGRDEEEEEDEEDAAPRRSRSTGRRPARPAPVDLEEDEDDEDEEEEEEVITPRGKRTKADRSGRKRTPVRSVPVDLEEDDDEEDEDDEPVPVSKSRGRRASGRRPVPPVEEDDDWEEAEFGDEDADDDEDED